MEHNTEGVVWAPPKGRAAWHPASDAQLTKSHLSPSQAPLHIPFSPHGIEYIWTSLLVSTIDIIVNPPLPMCSIVSNSATPWTVSHEAPLPMEFSRQEYWSGLPCPLPGDFLKERSNPCLTSTYIDKFFTTRTNWENVIFQINQANSLYVLWPNFVSIFRISNILYWTHKSFSQIS